MAIFIVTTVNYLLREYNVTHSLIHVIISPLIRSTSSCQELDTSYAKYINCFWSPPFSLVSIPGYIINVTYGGELVTQNTTSSTTWQYCPSQFGTYTISVAGNNSAGEINTTSLHVPGGIITMVTIV